MRSGAGQIGLLLVGLNLQPSGRLHASGLLVVGVAGALVGGASLMNPLLLWAVGPYRRGLSTSVRVAGTLVYALALAAGIGTSLWLAR